MLLPPSSGAPDVAPFCFDDAEVALIPIEDLQATGMSDACERRLLQRPHAVRVRHVFDASFARVHRMATALAAAAPDVYPPPRLSNIALLADSHQGHPYFRPFIGMSLVLYATDFDPESSSIEHAAYQLIVAERLGQTKRAGLAALEALPYLSSLSAEATADFCTGAARSKRPDAEAARLVAAALPVLLDKLRCDGLVEDRKPPSGYARIKGTPLVVSLDVVPVIQGLVKRLDAIAVEVAEQHYTRQRARTADLPSASDRLLAYLNHSCPRLLIVDGPNGRLLWDPQKPAELTAIAAAISQAGDRPLESLLLDLRAVDAVTALFFARVKDAASFLVPNQSLEEAGGVYVQKERALLAYALEQPGLSTLREEAPPFHRQLLVLRAMHEWGHVAVDAGVVPVPSARAADFEAAGVRLAGVFAKIVDALPSEARSTADAELARMRDEGTRLEDLPFSRLEDYRSNLLCRHLLPPGPLDVYVRANVRSLESEPVGQLRKLARYAYEAQYLFLAGFRDPLQYLFEGTFFREEYTVPGLVSEDMTQELVLAVGALCACYELDKTRILPG